MNIFKGVNAKVFYSLLILSIFATFTSLPYLLSLDAMAPNPASEPPFQLILLLLTYSALFAVAIFVGLKAAKPAGLSLKGFEGLTGNKTVAQSVGSFWSQSLVLGVIFALVVGVVELLCAVLFDVAVIQNVVGGSVSERLIAVFFDAINVEIVWRLLVMSVITWFAVKLNKDKKLSSVGMWTVIVITALLAGVLQLPSLIHSDLISVTPRLVLRVLFVNLISGGLFGYLYWKNGLLSSMLAHFAYAVTIFVALPVLLNLA